MTVENWKKNSKNDVFDTAESIFANPLFGISTRIEQIPIFPQILKSEKVEKNENLVEVSRGTSFWMRTYVRTVV